MGPVKTPTESSNVVLIFNRLLKFLGNDIELCLGKEVKVVTAGDLTPVKVNEGCDSHKGVVRYVNWT